MPHHTVVFPARYVSQASPPRVDRIGSHRLGGHFLSSSGARSKVQLRLASIIQSAQLHQRSTQLSAYTTRQQVAWGLGEPSSIPALGGSSSLMPNRTSFGWRRSGPHESGRSPCLPRIRPRGPLRPGDPGSGHGGAGRFDSAGVMPAEVEGAPRGPCRTPGGVDRGERGYISIVDWTWPPRGATAECEYLATPRMRLDDSPMAGRTYWVSAN